MSNSTKPLIELELPMEIPEIKQENPSFDQEMPTVTTLLNRKKIDPQQNPIEVHPPVASTPSQATNSTKKVGRPVTNAATKQITKQVRSSQSGNGQPPPFNRILILEKLDLKTFPKELKKSKKSLNNRKLACLGFFSKYFTEIVYLSATEPPGQILGVLGFGSPQLVSDIRQQTLNAALVPTVFEFLSQNEIFLGSGDSLKPKDKACLTTIGFSKAQFVGIFPVSFKKKLQGVFICTTATPFELQPKEKKELKKILADLNLSS